MATAVADRFPGYTTGSAETITTITSENNNYKRTGAGTISRSNRHSFLGFRHVSSCSEEDGSHPHSRRFHNGLKLLGGHGSNSISSIGDVGVKRHHQARSQSSQGSGGSGTEYSPSGSTLASSPAMTKEEYESLPLTIRRKYFSTLERLRFAQDPEPDDTDITPSTSLDNLPKLHPNTIPATAVSNNTTTTTTTTTTTAYTSHCAATASFTASPPGRSLQDKHQPVRLAVLSRLPSESNLAPSLNQRPKSALIRLPSNAAASNRHSTLGLGLGLGIINQPERHQPAGLTSRQGVILDATDEALIKRGKRHSHIPGRQSNSQLHRAVSHDLLSHRMHSRTNDGAWMDGRIKETENTLYDSLRWLEEDDNLDLSLDLVDEYHLGLRQDAANRKSRSSSIRRKLSASSKMAFSRASSTLSRPTTKEASTPFGGSVLSLQNPPANGHVRRRSRALSLMSATKQPPPEVTTVASPRLPMDPAAHYQDPEARMKLRVYLASPHKFDEAVEFGFPSTEQQPQSPTSPTNPPRRVDSLSRNANSANYLRMQTLVEDKRCSRYSEETTATESDSPRTPDSLEKAASFTVESKEQETPKVDYAQAHAYAREMTLRMTLTRPDLRANEEQIYGWQKARPTTSSESPRSPVGPKTQDEFKKDSIERQLAAIDTENLLYPEQGAMKRFWNRVRRT